MTCSACSAHVEKAVSAVDGVSSCSVNLLSNSMSVDFDEAVTGTDKIIAAVIDAGYGAEVAGDNSRNKQKAASDKQIAELKAKLEQGE